MTLSISPVSETPMLRRGMKAILDALQLDLSEKDLQESYPALDSLLPRRFLEGQEGSLRLADAFASPLYSDECKRYFAATHADIEGVFLAGDRFLSEEIILHHVETLTFGWQRMNYLKNTNLLVSSHLSESILEAIFLGLGEYLWKDALDLIPDIFVTPRVVTSWRSALLYDSSIFNLAWGLHPLRL